jgi:PAS domain S-box-containing protein
MRLSTPVRLLATYGSALLVLALCGLTYEAVQRSRASTAAVTRTHEVIIRLETTLSDVRDAETGQRGFLLTGEERYLEPYRSGTQRFDRDLQRLRELTSENPAQQRRIEALRRLGSEKMAFMAELVRVRAERGMEPALALVRTGRGKLLMDQVRRIVAEMRVEEERILRAQRAEEKRRRGIVMGILLGGGLLASGLALLISVLFARHARAQQAAAGELEGVNRLLQERASLLEMQSGQLRRRAVEEAALSEVARSLTTTFEVEEVLRRIADGALTATQARAAFVERVDDARTRVELVAGAGEGFPALGTSVPYAGSLAEDVLERDEPEWIADVTRESRAIAPAIEESCGPCAALVVPLISEHDALGALVLLQEAGHPPFRQDEITRARTLADLAAIALRRVILYTEAERRRAALEESEGRFRLLVDSVQDYAIVMLDPEGRVASWNQGAERIKGYTAAEVVGSPLAIFYPEEEAEHAATHLRIATSEGRFEEDGWRVKKDGTRFWAHVVINAIRGERGELLGFVDVAGDLTDRHRAELARETYLQQERRARAEADAANRAKSQFLATMSHEIRTPINAILGYSDLLDMELKGPLTPGQREQVERIQKSSQHLLGLVNDVLDLSKVEAGEMSVDARPAPLRATARAALELVEPQAAAKGIVLSDVSDCGANVQFVGDDDRVRQILLNLLSNAVKFTKPEGSVTIRCAVARTAPEEARLHGPGPWTLMEVADTGVGIPSDQQVRVFEPFTQVEGGYTRTQGGTGLGLAISRHLARLMGGDLIVASTPDEGSRFTLWLPATRESVSAEPADVLRWPDRAGEVAGLGEVGRIVAEGADELVRSLGARLREDPRIPGARELDRAQLEDHISTFLLDIGKSLVTLDEGGGEPALMRDGSDIQRLISERHGDQRRRLEWSTDALRAEFALLREIVEAHVRAEAPARTRDDVDTALAILNRLLSRAEEIALRGWGKA